MAKRIAKSTLQASTMDIMNSIRQYAGYDYQQNVPLVAKAADIPHVGEVIFGTPAFSNQFLNALVNRIGLVRVKSATFNNPYARLKKGYLGFGETIEEIFVNIAQCVDYTPEKGAAREFKRTIPDVRSAFHVMNWRVMYPVTIQDEDLKLAFTAEDGVQNLIAKIVDAVYTAAEYDEYLLFKYLIIKQISHGKTTEMQLPAGDDLKKHAALYRGISNDLTFMKSKYNAEHVKNTTPRERQIIFMDSWYNGQFDVDVLAAAFNMDKANFLASLYLIDDFADFDNDRFNVIRENSDGLEEVTPEELAQMKHVKAFVVDEEWFQVYDNNNKFTEKYVASGLYWNYFYHVWKTVSVSPFANAVTFVDSDATVAPKASYTAEITGKDTSDVATVFTLGVQDDTATLVPGNYQFMQTEQATTDGIAVLPYGAVMIPATSSAKTLTLKMKVGDTEYDATATINAASAVGATVTMQKQG